MNHITTAGRVTTSNTQAAENKSAGSRRGGGRPHLDSSQLTATGQLEFKRPAWLSHYPWNQRCVGAHHDSSHRCPCQCIPSDKQPGGASAHVDSLVFLRSGTAWEGLVIKHLACPRHCISACLCMWKGLQRIALAYHWIMLVFQEALGSVERQFIRTKCRLPWYVEECFVERAWWSQKKLQWVLCLGFAWITLKVSKTTCVSSPSVRWGRKHSVD